MRQHWLINSLIGVVFWALASLALTGVLSSMAITQAQAQTVSLPGLGDGGEEETADVSGEEFQASPSDVITLLESEERRTELLTSLRELQVTTDAATEDEGVVRQGLLGALADTDSLRNFLLENLLSYICMFPFLKKQHQILQIMSCLKEQ